VGQWAGSARSGVLADRWATVVGLVRPGNERVEWGTTTVANPSISASKVVATRWFTGHSRAEQPLTNVAIRIFINQMQILVNTDNNIEGREKFATYVKGEVEHALGRFRERIIRVEVHLSDEKGTKGGQDDKRCVMEAHLNGLQPVAVTHHAASVGQAVDGAVQKMKRSLDSTLDKIEDRR
jgi:ribosome-associated translation inhibitor RaiA